MSIPHGMSQREADALSEAAMVFADHGIEFKLPWNCDLDDLEADRFKALQLACKSYLLAFAALHAGEGSQ